jgi:hypothetical protein
MQVIQNTEINHPLPMLEPFMTARQVVDSGLFPDLTEEKLRYYVRQGLIRAYGPGKNKTYLLQEVYEDWKNIGRRLDGVASLQTGPQGVGGRLPKAWRKV